MKITVIGTDANDIANTVAVAHAIRQCVDREGYKLAVIEAISGEEKPHVVLVREDDIVAGPPYTAVSVTDPPKLFHLGVSSTPSATLAGDTLADRQPDPDGEPVRDNLGCGVADPVADADAVTVACGARVCSHLDAHRHGFACNAACPCKATRYRSGSDAPGSSLGGSRSASETSEVSADHPRPSEAADAAPTASAVEEVIVRLRDLLRRGGQ